MSPSEIKEQLRLKREERQALIKTEAIEMPVHRIGIGDPNGYRNEHPPELRRRVNGAYAPETKLPQSIDAEKAVLGSILLAPLRCMREAERTIGKNYFHHPSHGLIFEALTEMNQDGTPINLVSLSQYLEDTGRLEKVGGPGYVTEVINFVNTATNFSYYLEIIKEKHALRQIAKLGEELSFDAINGGDIRVVDLIERAQDGLHKLQSFGRNGSLPALDDMSMLIGENRPPLPPELVKGILHRGNKIIIGGTSKGKKTFSLMDLAGSGVFARDPDSILTMTAHEEDDCFTVDVTLRNFAPAKPFVLRWDWPLFVRDDLLNPEEIKKPKKMVHGSNGQFPEKFSEPDVIEVLVRQGDIGRRTEEARKLILNETGMSSRSFYRIWKKLQETARITQKDGRWFTV